MDSFNDKMVSHRQTCVKIRAESLGWQEDKETCLIKWKISKFRKGAHILWKLFSQFIKEIVEGMIGYIRLLYFIVLLSFDILTNLQKDQRLIQIENVPQLRLAPPAVYHEKVKKGSDLHAVCHGVLICIKTKGEGLELYEDMVLGRRFEDMCTQMYYRDKMFRFVHLYNGQEAVSAGFIKLLKKKDFVVSTYCAHVHALSKGVPARGVISELFGKTTGCCQGQGGSMHMFSKEHNLLSEFAFVGEGIPVATGASFTSEYQREVLKEVDCDHVTVTFFVDGTCNNGQFFECLNMAALWKLPIVFVVKNNLWAIGMSHLRATSVPEIWKKELAFGIPGVHVDGMDVFKVREVAKEALQGLEAGRGLPWSNVRPTGSEDTLWLIPTSFVTLVTLFYFLPFSSFFVISTSFC
ncbi:pyruvate dehydrogenase (acetyl-transferring) [Sarracenia purpurea var. burkii]